MSFHISLDPGRNTGLALYDAKRRKLICLETLDFWQVISKINQLSNIYKIDSVIIENPGLNKPVFMSKDQTMGIKDAFERMNRYARISEAAFNVAAGDVEKAIRIHSSKAQKVGRNKEQAFLLIDWLERNNYRIVEVRPHLPKMNHDSFCNMTGWKGRTNEHVRDAGRLLWGLKI